MVSTFPEARAVLEEVDEALKFKLSDIMLHGPEEDLKLTENAQPAVLAHSIAALTVYMRIAKGTDYGRADWGDVVMAGHSLGEWSALVAAGALSLRDAARLVRERGAAMQTAVGGQSFAVTAVFPIALDVATALADEAAEQTGRVCAVANHNSAAQVVWSGHKTAVDLAVRLGKERRKLRRAVPLAVSAPFHCALMRQATHAVDRALQAATVRAPRATVIANYSAEPYDRSEHAEVRAKEMLVRQVEGRVRWLETMQTMDTLGVRGALQFGNGNVLTGLLKGHGIPCESVGTVSDMREHDLLSE